MFKANTLSLPVNKTYYVVFHLAIIKVDNDTSNWMKGSRVNSASRLIRYLGVIIDSKLNWIPHITYVKNKIYKGIGIMFKARDYLNKNNICQTCAIPIYFHISFTALKCGVMRPIVTYFPCF